MFVIGSQYVMLCPEGCEGITYALLTTIGNLAGTIASDIGTGLTLIWNVDNDVYVAFLHLYFLLKFVVYFFQLISSFVVNDCII